MIKNIVETIQLTKMYKKKCSVTELNLKIPEGSIYGFLGPNGAGKTTTIRMILGLIKPTEGEIKIFEKKLIGNRDFILGQTGSLVESPSYYGHLTGYKNLEILTTMLGLPKSRIDEKLKLVGLETEKNKLVKNYSLGMKQRLGIAAALINNPKLLILDEPTNGLDPSGIQEIRNLIKELSQKSGITILISSHLLSEVNQIATHVGIINNGQLIYQDTLTNLQRQGESKLHIELSKAKEAFLYLKECHLNADLVSEEKIVLDSISKNKTAEIIEQLVFNKHSIYSVTEVRKSLEDLFLTLTQKGDLL
ncbi:ABC transporter ATP-binding protein [Lysinibacillus sp. JNUCC 51]|uniref:ABC transporter ATP-binding protein n=1 Tax=Lysinibacillus sp. JNUCC-51 TaxID=2792479 RepID=UPI001936E9B4|nr:ABC transporter ATP-binding protein [Lysinibacillus sp. JNUCC-51]